MLSSISLMGPQEGVEAVTSPLHIPLYSIRLPNVFDTLPQTECSIKHVHCTHEGLEKKKERKEEGETRGGIKWPECSFCFTPTLFILFRLDLHRSHLLRSYIDLLPNRTIAERSMGARLPNLKGRDSQR